jgi:glycerol-3-phosphate dehydrogenase subunit C
MSGASESAREGSLDAPTRHPLNWRDEDFWSEESLNLELERVFDICHGCRRCHSLCNAFPTLFDLIDQSATLEVDGVDQGHYHRVVDQCYLCDMCFQAKCPYVPPHEWNVDFPHLMLRAKAIAFRGKKPPLKHRILASTDAVGRLASIPVVTEAVNAANRSPTLRKVLEKVLGVHHQARLPEYHSDTLRRRMRKHPDSPIESRPGASSRGKVALFATCYCNVNAPDIGSDLIKVLEHNEIPVCLVDRETCCGMPRYEHGNLEAVEQAMQLNIPQIEQWIDQGFDVLTPIPSCTLMFKQVLPLLFPDHESVNRVSTHVHDPFEYLAARHAEGLLNTCFKHSLGRVAWHVPCHQRVQRIGAKTREILEMAPETTVVPIERCSGHNGTYGVRAETFRESIRIARGTLRRIEREPFDHFVSDCPMAATHLAGQLGMEPGRTTSPISLLRQAYGL